MNFVLLAHRGRTGGPEAIHQLADALASLHFNAYVHYASEEFSTLRAACESKNQYPEYEGIHTIEAYDHLPDVVLVLPEIWAHHALELARSYMVLVWWLSVDSGLLSLGRIGHNLDYYRSHPGILNAYQSAYAKAFLQSLGLNTYDLSLTDYTQVPSLTRDFRCGLPSKPITICFNPSKGGWLAALFKTYHPEVNLFPIAGMPPDQVRTALAAADVYVDFGQLPGKDRIPREALIVGTRIFLRQNGDGAFDSDWLLPKASYFQVSDCLSGALMQAIESELIGDSLLWQRARQRVACERDVFLNECAHIAEVFLHLMHKPDVQSVVKNQINISQRKPDPLETTERKLATAESKRVTMLKSTSWKITGPLRRATALISRVFPRRDS